MAEGLRPHYCQMYLYDIKKYKERRIDGCMVKRVTYRCMICGNERIERYFYKPPPKHKRKEVER